MLDAIEAEPEGPRIQQRTVDKDFFYELFKRRKWIAQTVVRKLTLFIFLNSDFLVIAECFFLERTGRL
jgi:hypothetical protein